MYKGMNSEPLRFLSFQTSGVSKLENEFYLFFSRSIGRWF
ncbi:hypothetical protein LEP1GSC202_1124 [Leptospira yanagawae serovar Saopaulo str. Sao Paulo = ATCC 700523]|uniref:Uncharacterized protein n=1 Tax=Leptospira yanagawae serovar Saopaulo str. Sao Paulo = ATCC 700523 TaxID=1249483 RepID=A0A5E8HDA8_9LEPT|nr:hypothetical protein LEP1GSC202_1124 [Leptospira yanagawae serovar Saopaulo str. Sao Paulo = ATCC 700523]